MTYLELVNDVLTRLREDNIETVIGQEDTAIQMVIKLVNDAKAKVEAAWTWEALRTEWEVTGIAAQSDYTLDAVGHSVVNWASNDTDGYFLKRGTPQFMKKKSWGNPANGKPIYFSVMGKTPTEVYISFFPTPATVQTYTVAGFKAQPALELDADELLIPSTPVIYEALAMASRERGEVAGQTSLEIFGVAKAYLADAIALDAQLNNDENIWVSV